MIKQQRSPAARQQLEIGTKWPLEYTTQQDGAANQHVPPYTGRPTTMPCLVGRPSGTTRSSCQPLACSSAPHSLALRSLLPHMTSICIRTGQREGAGAGARELPNLQDQSRQRARLHVPFNT